MGKQSDATKTTQPIDSSGSAGVWIALDELQPWGRNPRKIGSDKVDEAVSSLRRFGFCAPVVLWGSRSMIVAGHARLAGMRKILSEDPGLDGRGGADADLAKRNEKLLVSLGGPSVRHVPVRVREFDSLEEAEAYALRDNNQIGQWDDESLKAVIRDLHGAGVSLDGIGFDPDTIADMLGQGGEAGGGLDGDDEEPGELSDDWLSQPGEVYELGPHRLVCGDSTDPAVWARVMGPDKADLVWTDPPYGVAYVGKTKDAMTIQNDALNEEKLGGLLRASLGRAADASRDGAAWYVASPPGSLFHVFGTVLRELEIWRHTLVWVKDALVLGRSDYHYKHEPIFYGWKPGAGHYFVDERTHTSTLEFPRPKRSDIHPTMKPVELVRYCIRNSSRPGSVVVDAFGGSGTTLIAAASEGRVARLVELDPRFCDAIRRRWTTFARSAGVDPGSGGLG